MDELPGAAFNLGARVFNPLPCAPDLSAKPHGDRSLPKRLAKLRSQKIAPKNIE